MKKFELDEIVNVLSVLYRKELEKNNKMQEDLQQMIDKEDSDDYKNISSSELVTIANKISWMENNLKNREIYCSGIFNAREEFLNM